MLAPQSDDEVRPVVEALRRRDPLLDVRWNPKAVTLTKPSYDVLGGRTDGTYDGRWEVVRYDLATSLHEDRAYVVITTVTAPVHYKNGVSIMQADGPYAPIGFWLVDYMDIWDAANVHYQEAMAAAWAEHDQVDEIKHQDARAAHQAGLEKVYREHGGGEYWMGGAQGKASPAAEQALFRARPEAGSTAPRTTPSTPE